MLILSTRIIHESAGDSYNHTEVLIRCIIAKVQFFIVGGDAGVGFDSRYIPEKELQISIISNRTDGEEKIRDVIYSELEKSLL